MSYDAVRREGTMQESCKGETHAVIEVARNFGMWGRNEMVRQDRVSSVIASASGPQRMVFPRYSLSFGETDPVGVRADHGNRLIDQASWPATSSKGASRAL